MVIAFSRSNSANLLHSMFGFMHGQRAGYPTGATYVGYRSQI
jgi:hypothetical protein